MQIASEIKSSNMHTLDLVSDGVMSGTGNPSAGAFEYGAIRVFIKDAIYSTPVSREAAPVVILNGTGVEGFAQAKADVLTEAGFNVAFVNNAPEDIYDKVEIYQIDDGNIETANALSTMFGVTIKKTAPPVIVNGNIRFVIIFGDATS